VRESAQPEKETTKVRKLKDGKTFPDRPGGHQRRFARVL
jgi:hypothetical protein